MTQATWEVGSARLLKLATLLETLPPVVFDLDSWFSHPGDEELICSYVRPEDLVKMFGQLPSDQDVFSTPPEPQAMHECGYTACAVGWACAIPEFRAEGLRMSADLGTGLPVYGDRMGCGAVEHFFGINYNDLDNLFLTSSYRGAQPATPADVAARIRELVAEF